MTYYIYTLSFKGEPFYVGITQDAKVRYNCHSSYLNADYPISRYLKKHISMEIVDTARNKNQLSRLERECIKKFQLSGVDLVNKHKTKAVFVQHGTLDPMVKIDQETSKLICSKMSFEDVRRLTQLLSVSRDTVLNGCRGLSRMPESRKNKILKFFEINLVLS